MKYKILIGLMLMIFVFACASSSVWAYDVNDTDTSKNAVANAVSNTEISFDPNGDYSNFNVTIPNSNSLQNLTLEGNGATLYGSGRVFTISGTRDLTIKNFNIIVSSGGTGVDGAGNSPAVINFTLLNCNITTVGGDGRDAINIYQNAEGIAIVGNNISGFTRNGISITNHMGAATWNATTLSTYIANNIISDVGEAIFIGGNFRGIIEGNTITGATIYGLQFVGRSGTSNMVIDATVRNNNINSDKLGLVLNGTNIYHYLKFDNNAFEGDTSVQLSPLASFDRLEMINNQFIGEKGDLEKLLSFNDLDTVPPIVTSNFGSGIYNTPFNLVLTLDKLGKIYYTTDGSDPSSSLTRMEYTGPITIGSTTTLKYIAINNDEFSSVVYDLDFVIDTVPPIVTSNIGSGLYNTPLNVVLTISKTGKIYYTTDGSSPSSSPTRMEYTDPITIGSTTTLKYIAIDEATNPSESYVLDLVIDTVPPTVNANVDSGIYFGNITVVLTISKTGKIYYTTDGSNPSSSPTRMEYTGPITISSTSNLRYMAVDNARNPSQVYLLQFDIQKSLTPSHPVQAAGSYNKNVIVDLPTVKGSTLYYSIDNNVYREYAGPFTVIKTSNIRYYYQDANGVKSQVRSVTYTIDKTPPKVMNTNTKKNKIVKSKKQTLKVKFSETVRITKANLRKIVVKTSNGGLIKASVSVKKNILSVKVPKIAKKVRYTITIPKNIVADIAGNMMKSRVVLRYRTR